MLGWVGSLTIRGDGLESADWAGAEDAESSEEEEGVETPQDTDPEP